MKFKKNGMIILVEPNCRMVIGDEWHAGNLSYQLKSKPKWYSHSAAFVDKSAEDFIETIGKNGLIIVNGACPYGTSFKIQNIEICNVR